MSELAGESASWTGEGIGPGREIFFHVIRDTLPDYPAEEAAEAVLCSLLRRVSGGLAERVVEELPSELRPLAGTCARHDGHPAPAWDKDQFYGDVAEHLMADANDVRRILSAVFSGLHSQISEATAEHIARQLPADLSGTWRAARRRVVPPHRVSVD